MGRLLAVGALIMGALVAVLVVNGTGPAKPEPKDAKAPAKEAAAVAPTTTTQRNASGKPPVVVRMKDLRFRPDAVSVDVGQPVKFVNDDDVAHAILEDVGARSGEIPAIDSKRILPGQTFTFVPRSTGLVPFICTLHPSVMMGQVLVEKAPV